MSNPVSNPVSTPEEKLYTWHGRDANGNCIDGQQRATSPAQLRATLLINGIRAQRIRRIRESWPKWLPKPAAQVRFRLNTAQQHILLEQLHSLLHAGLPMLQALEIASNSATCRMQQRMLTLLREDITQGQSLSSALQQRVTNIDRISLNLLANGEQSGTLDRMLQSAGQLLARRQHNRAQIHKAMRYPLIVLVVSLLVCYLLLTRVVPAFARSFADLGSELPMLTQQVVSLSQMAPAAGLWILIISALLSTSLYFGHRHMPAARLLLDTLLLYLPGPGGVLRLASLSRICHSLHINVASGLPLLQAISATGNIAGNAAYERALSTMVLTLEKGQSLTEAIRAEPLFPVMIAQLAGAGEQSGTLETMLGKCGDYYQAQLDNKIAALLSLLEPAMMVILGGMTGALMLAMYLPVFQMGNLL